MVGKEAMRLDAGDRPVSNFAVRNKPCRLKVAGELYDFDRQLARVPNEETDTNLHDPLGGVWRSVGSPIWGHVLLVRVRVP